MELPALMRIDWYQKPGEFEFMDSEISGVANRFTV
jgi:hypothetical protein